VIDAELLQNLGMIGSAEEEQLWKKKPAKKD
jgi:hypothetical protein